MLPPITPPIRRVETDDGRFYDTPAGMLPSITSMLAATKPAADQAALDDWRARVGNDEAERIRYEATKRGTALHEMLERYLADGTPGSGEWWQSLTDALPRILEVHGIERAVYHPGVAAGTFDLLCEWKTNKGSHLAIVDLKTASRPKKKRWLVDYAQQVAFYAGAVNWMLKSAGRPERVHLGVVLIACVENGEVLPAQAFHFTKQSLISQWRNLTERAKEFRDARDVPVPRAAGAVPTPQRDEPASS